MFAKNEKAAQQILDTECLYTANNIARAIHAPGWDVIELPNLKEHMKEKYLQNLDCRKELLATGTKQLRELTWDRKWAVGYGPYSKLFHTHTQPGQNLTGYTLEEIRTELRQALQAVDRSRADQHTGVQDNTGLIGAEGGETQDTGLQYRHAHTDDSTPKQQLTHAEHRRRSSLDTTLIRTSPITQV